MAALIKKNLYLWGYGKVLALFIGCLLFAISQRQSEGSAISFEQHLLSAATNHYYLTYFLLPILLLSCFAFLEDDSEEVILRFGSYYAYFWQKWLGVGLIAFLLVAVQSAAILLSGLGLPWGDQWSFAAKTADAELFMALGQYFSAPLQAFGICTLYQFCGSWLILGICMWMGHFGGRKWSIRVCIALYLLSAAWIKLPSLQTLPLTGFNHLLILHHNFGAGHRWAVTVMTECLVIMIILITVQWGRQGQRACFQRYTFGLAAYYSRHLLTRRNFLILGAVIMVMMIYKGCGQFALRSGQQWLYSLFAGHGTGGFRVLPFLEMLIINGAPLYLLASFIEKMVSSRSFFISVRAISRRKLLQGIVAAGTKFLVVYALLWFIAGFIGLWATGGDVEPALWKMLFYAVVMKFFDLMVQYLVLMGLYVMTKQITIGFLVLLMGNLLCIVPWQGMVYLPFGLSSLTRIAEMNFGAGLSAGAALGWEAALTIAMLAGLFVFGSKKILD